MSQVNKHEIEAVLKQSPRKKYKYFINKVADNNCLWGLYDDGWALSSDSDGNKFIPLWPTREFAELSTEEIWENFQPSNVDLNDFIHEYAQELEKDGIQPALFYSSEDRGIVLSMKDLLRDLKEELDRIE